MAHNKCVFLLGVGQAIPENQQTLPQRSPHPLKVPSAKLARESEVWDRRSDGRGVRAAGQTGGFSCMFAVWIQILESVRNSGSLMLVPGHRGEPVSVKSRDSFSALDCLTGKRCGAGEGTDGVLLGALCHFLA